MVKGQFQCSMETRRVWGRFGLHSLNRIFFFFQPPSQDYNILIHTVWSCFLFFFCNTCMKSATPALPSPSPKLCRAQAHSETGTPGRGLGDNWKELCEVSGANVALGAGQPGSSQEPCVRPAHAARNGARPALLERRCWRASHDVTTAERKRERKWWSQTKGQEEKAEKQKCFSPCRVTGAAAGAPTQSPLAI